MIDTADEIDAGSVGLSSDQLLHLVDAPICVLDVRNAAAALRDAKVEAVPEAVLRVPGLDTRLAKGIRIVAANRACAQLVGLDDHGAMLSTADRFVARRGWPILLEQLRLLMGGATANVADMPLRSVTGRKLLVEIRVRAPEVGEKLSRVIVALTDVTDRAAERAKEEQSLRFLNAIVENLPNMVFVKKAPELSFILFNRAGEELLGTSRVEMYGKTDFDFFPEEQARFFTEADRQVFAEQAGANISEEPIATATGERWLHTRKVPLFDDDGEPAYLLGISDDITELRQIRDELRQRTEALERSNKDLRDFAYIASHDLNEPLRTIGGFAELIGEEVADSGSENLALYLHHLRGGVRRTQDLLDGLLHLSRVGSRRFEYATVELSHLAGEVVAALGSAISEAEAQVSVDAALELTTDKVMLGRVLQNLKTITNRQRCRKTTKTRHWPGFCWCARRDSNP